MADVTLSDVVDRLKAEGQLTRNSGKHSIKTIKEILQENQKTSLQDREDAREQGQKQDRQLDLLDKIAAGVKDGVKVEGGKDTGGGGLFKGLLGGAIGGLGAGLGLGAAGLGVLAFGGSALIDSIANLDAQKIKDNINILLSIGDDLERADKSMFIEGGTLALVLGGIGIGLAAFGVGSGVNAAVDYFAGDSKWAESVVKNVKTLLSISDEKGALDTFASGLALAPALGAIGVGLIAFGIGSGVTAAVDYFAKDDWAVRVKDNVVTLLSIKDALGGNLGMLADSAAFTGAMATIALGLVAFSIGQGTAAAADAVTSSIEFFTKEGWAQKIVDNITTLMKIRDIAGIGDSIGLAATLGSIGFGLAAFSLGQGAAGVAEAINKFASEEDFADRIVRQVTTLVGLTDLIQGDGDSTKSGQFALGMAKLSAGIAAFTLSDGVGSLVSAGQAVLSFFGAKSPFEKLMEIADNADELKKGGDALEQITRGLNAFGNIQVSDVDVDFEQLGRNLSKAIPFLQAAASGGTVEGGWFSSDVNFGPYKGPGKGGILDPDLHLDQLAGASMKMNTIFSGSPAGMTQSLMMPDDPESTNMVQRLQAVQEFSSANLESATNANQDAKLQQQQSAPPVSVGPTINAPNNSQTIMNNGTNVGISENSMNPYNPDRGTDDWVSP